MRPLSSNDQRIHHESEGKKPATSETVSHQEGFFSRLNKIKKYVSGAVSAVIMSGALFVASAQAQSLPADTSIKAPPAASKKAAPDILNTEKNPVDTDSTGMEDGTEKFSFKASQGEIVPNIVVDNKIELPTEISSKFSYIVRVPYDNAPVGIEMSIFSGDKKITGEKNNYTIPTAETPTTLSAYPTSLASFVQNIVQEGKTGIDLDNLSLRVTLSSGKEVLNHFRYPVRITHLPSEVEGAPDNQSQEKYEANEKDSNPISINQQAIYPALSPSGVLNLLSESGSKLIYRIGANEQRKITVRVGVLSGGEKLKSHRYKYTTFKDGGLYGVSIHPNSLAGDLQNRINLGEDIDTTALGLTVEFIEKGKVLKKYEYPATLNFAIKTDYTIKDNVFTLNSYSVKGGVAPYRNTKIGLFYTDTNGDSQNIDLVPNVPVMLPAGSYLFCKSGEDAKGAKVQDFELFDIPESESRKTPETPESVLAPGINNALTSFFRKLKQL